MESGNLSLNINENSMKYDFKEVSYCYDPLSNDVVAVDDQGQIIHDYSRERIPEGDRFSRLDGAVPINMDGAVMDILS